MDESRESRKRQRKHESVGRVADGRSDAVVPPLRSERGHKTILTVWLKWMPDAVERTVHSVTLTRSVKRFASPSSFSRLDSNILDIFLCILLSCSFPTHCLPLPRLPAGCGTLKCLQFFDEVSCGRHNDRLRIGRSRSMG